MDFLFSPHPLPAKFSNMLSTEIQRTPTHLIVSKFAMSKKKFKNVARRQRTFRSRLTRQPRFRWNHLKRRNRKPSRIFHTSMIVKSQNYFVVKPLLLILRMPHISPLFLADRYILVYQLFQAAIQKYWASGRSIVYVVFLLN